jgi:predicted AlkP superfamily phosphohydrolase/phosphomutase
MRRGKPLVVLGLDGATWNLLEPWMDKGALPHLRLLRDKGAYGVLRSVTPPVSCPAWKCYSTGKGPGKLGVYWWVDVDWRARTISVHDSTSFQGREIWDYLSEEGFKCAVINMPTTYPPKKVNGFLIASVLSPEGSEYTYPPELGESIEQAYGYKIRPTFHRKQKRRSVDNVKDMITRRFRLLSDTIASGSYDFMHLTIFYINVLQHFYWNDDLVREAWQTIDLQLGDLCQHDCNIMIMSDHGSAKMEATFHINTWLQRQGYLSTKRSIGDLLAKSGLSRDGIKAALQKLGLADLVRRTVPQQLLRIIPEEGGLIEAVNLDLKLDWERSVAVGLGQGPIYLNRDVMGTDYDAFCDRLIRDLESLRRPGTGHRLIGKVYRQQELYGAEARGRAPDLLAVPADGYHISGSLGGKVLDVDNEGWLAENHPHGIFVAHGQDIKPGLRVEGAQIVDLAPTVLHWMGLPVPEDTDGKVLKEIFQADSDAAQRPVRYFRGPEKESIPAAPAGLSTEEQEEVKERLRGLGYLE